MAIPNKLRLPRHIAIVMDGNGRWAKKHFLPRSAGHRAGVKRTREIVAYCGQLGIESLSLFAFSSENWSRPRAEVGLLMKLLLESLQKETQQLHQNQVKLQIIGCREALPQDVQNAIRSVETLTQHNTGLKLNVAINYGGKWDILQAVNTLYQQALQGEIMPPFNEAQLAQHLSVAEQADPDLFIRTSGEIRISNFFLWQTAYSELYFTEVPWPGFDKHQLDLALDWYASRERRFGQTSRQLAED